jgi:hypothetical protein
MAMHGGPFTSHKPSVWLRPPVPYTLASYLARRSSDDSARYEACFHLAYVWSVVKSGPVAGKQRGFEAV